MFVSCLGSDMSTPLHELAGQPENGESLAMLQLVLGLHGSTDRQRAVTKQDVLKGCSPLAMAAASGNVQVCPPLACLEGLLAKPFRARQGRQCS